MALGVKASPITTNWGPFGLQGRNVLITGGAMGIGYGIAARFVEAGANVLVADISPMTQAAATHLDDRQAKAMVVDVTEPQACQGAVQRCVDEFGSIDVLVNDAGIFPTSSVLEMTPAFFDRVINVNLRGLVFMCQAAGRQMVKQGNGGKIVNVASIDSVHPSMAGLAAYDASKGGVLMFTKSFALEMAPHHVCVNAIAPGGITTEGTTKPLAGLSAKQMEEMTADFVKHVPLGRFGVPDDIAKVAVFLASSASDYMTGSLIVVDGGRLLT